MPDAAAGDGALPDRVNGIQPRLLGRPLLQLQLQHQPRAQEEVAGPLPKLSTLLSQDEPSPFSPPPPVAKAEEKQGVEETGRRQRPTQERGAEGPPAAERGPAGVQQEGEAAAAGVALPEASLQDIRVSSPSQNTSDEFSSEEEEEEEQEAALSPQGPHRDRPPPAAPPPGPAASVRRRKRKPEAQAPKAQVMSWDCRR